MSVSLCQVPFMPPLIWIARRVCVFSILRIVELNKYESDHLTCEYSSYNVAHEEIIDVYSQIAVHWA